MEMIVKGEKEVLNKWEIQNRALNKVINMIGTIENLSRMLGLDEKKGADRIKKWRNQGVKIPLGYAILIEYLTGISFELLSPFTEKTNKILRKLMMRGESPRVKLPVQDITIPKKNKNATSLFRKGDK